MKFLAQIVAGVHRVRLARQLTIEGRNHDDSGGTKLAGRNDDLTHRGVEELLHLRILGQNEAFESGADCRHLDAASRKGLADLLDPAGKTASVQFEAIDSEALHEIKFLCQSGSRSRSLLERNVDCDIGSRLRVLAGRSATRKQRGSGKSRCPCCRSFQK